MNLTQTTPLWRRPGSASALPAALTALGTATLLGLAGERVRLTTEHVDLAVVHQPDDPTNRLALVISDDDLGATYLSNQVVLVVAEAARTELPADIPPLGSAGDPLWILPQSPDPQVLFLGLSAEDVPPGEFPEALTLRLRGVAGPGHVLAWQVAPGGLDVRFNSRDGLDDNDQILLFAGGHAHMNFGFTTNGVFELVFEVQGRRAGAATNDFSLPTPIRFEVEPLPPPAETPFTRWQRTQWPGVDDPAVIGPAADPDGDGMVNAVEYALGLDPHRADRDRLPRPRLVETPAGRRLRLEFEHPLATSDVTFHAEQADAPAVADSWQPLSGPQVMETGGDRERLVFEVPADRARGFLRWEVRLQP
jgi:hypothetical protein